MRMSHQISMVATNNSKMFQNMAWSPKPEAVHFFLRTGRYSRADLTGPAQMAGARSLRLLCLFCCNGAVEGGHNFVMRAFGRIVPGHNFMPVADRTF